MLTGIPFTEFLQTNAQSEHANALGVMTSVNDMQYGLNGQMVRNRITAGQFGGPFVSPFYSGMVGEQSDFCLAYRDFATNSEEVAARTVSGKA